MKRYTSGCTHLLRVSSCQDDELRGPLPGRVPTWNYYSRWLARNHNSAVTCTVKLFITKNNPVKYAVLLIKYLMPITQLTVRVLCLQIVFQLRLEQIIFTYVVSISVLCCISIISTIWRSMASPSLRIACTASTTCYKNVNIIIIIFYVQFLHCNFELVERETTFLWHVLLEGFSFSFLYLDSRVDAQDQFTFQYNVSIDYSLY